jgi:hypothetical protein
MKNIQPICLRRGGRKTNWKTKFIHHILMERIFIFGDEFGTHSINEKEGVVSHFIYTAIAIKESNLQTANDLRNYLSEKYLFGHKLKSSSKALNDKTNFNKRIAIVKEICDNLDCAIYCLIVDKYNLDSEGLKFKEVFYKFFQNIFIEKFSHNYSNFSVNMHNIISGHFSQKMFQYLQKRNPSNLFNSYTYKMCSDEEEPLIQFADVIAGSLGRIFSNSHKHYRWEELYNPLTSKLITPVFFPNSSTRNIVFSNSDNEEKLDLEIYKIVQKDGETFLEEDNPTIQKIIVEHLLFYQKVDPFRLIETHELIYVIQRHNGPEITPDILRRHIRDTRYKGVMIVSLLGKSGYKLASSKSDIVKYFYHYMKYVMPMLQKVEIANNIFKGKTTGEFIPLDESEVALLKKIMNNINKPDNFE